MAKTINNATIAARYRIGTASTTVPYNTNTIINFDEKIYDSNDAVTIGVSWKYTAPVSGYYLVTSSVASNAVETCDSSTRSFYYRLYKNGSFENIILRNGFNGLVGYWRASGSTIVKLNKGDYFNLQVYQDLDTGGTASLTFVADSFNNTIEIKYIGP